MKVLVELTESDLKNLRSLDTALNKQLGNVYTGTNSMCLYFDFPNELCGLLRPKAGNTHLTPQEYEQLQNQLKVGSVTFELVSSKPQ